MKVTAFNDAKRGKRLMVDFDGLAFLRSSLSAEIEFDRLTREKSSSWKEISTEEVAQVEVTLGYAEPLIINRIPYKASFFLWVRDPAGAFYVEQPHYSGEQYIKMSRDHGQVTEAASNVVDVLRGCLIDALNLGQRDPIGVGACATNNHLRYALGKMVGIALGELVKEAEEAATRAMEELARLGGVAMAIRSDARQLRSKGLGEAAADNLSFVLRHRDFSEGLGGGAVTGSDFNRLVEIGRKLHPELWIDGHTGGGCFSMLPELQE